MAKLSKDAIKKAALKGLEESEGWEGDELSQTHAAALDYYYNRDRAAPTIAGRSDVQSSDVADMVEAVTAQIMPAFQMDNLAKFQPMGEDDVDQAQLESEAVSWVVMDQCNGFIEMQSAIRNALLLRNGIVKVYLDENISVKAESFEDLTELQFRELEANAVGSLEDIDNGYTVEEYGEPMGEGFHNVRVTVKKTERYVKTSAIDPVWFSWEAEWETLDLERCRFVAERSEVTRSELLDMGYPKRLVNQVKHGGNNTEVGKQARQQLTQRNNYQGVTPAEDICELYEIYMRLDADGDGQSELLQIMIAGDVLLSVEDAPFIPYAAGTAFLQPHRFLGLGLFDKLSNIQDAKTDALRQWLDNQKHANNARVGAVEGEVNMDDLVNSRPGGIVRMSHRDAIVPLAAPDIGASCAATLEYLDKVRSERGGASLDMQAAELQIAGETAHGVERQMSAKEQLAAHMTQTLSETLVRNTWLLVHKALREYVPDEMQFRSTGDFRRANPSQWPERKAVQVKAGISMAERMRKKAALETVVLRQDAMRQAGRYVSPDDAYNAETDWLRVQGINDPDRYFTDPGSEEAQQYAAQQAQAQQQQQQYQQALLDLQRMIEERKADNADAKVMQDDKQHTEEMQFKYWEAALTNDAQNAELAVTIMDKMRGEDDGAEGGSGAENTGTAGQRATG